MQRTFFYLSLGLMAEAIFCIVVQQAKERIGTLFTRKSKIVSHAMNTTYKEGFLIEGFAQSWPLSRALPRSAERKLHM